MKFSGIEIKGYRSFDYKEGILCKDFKKINIFIGKNNSGKSNVLRFIYLLNKINFPNLRDLPKNLFSDLDYFKNGAKRSESIKFKMFLRVDSKEKNKLTQVQFEGNEIYYDLIFSENKLKVAGGFYENFSFGQLNKFYLEKTNRYYTTKVQNDVILEDLVKRNCVEINFNLGSKIKIIKPFRIISADNYNDEDGSLLQGKGLIKKLNEMANPPVGREQDRTKFVELEKFVMNLLGDQDVKLEIPHTVDDLYICMKEKRLPLDSFGTGIHELVLLAAALTIYDNHIFCIEEPEIHLHPELERKFLRYIDENTNNTYFISTHSNIFLDKGDSENIQIYRVDYDGYKSTVTKCETDKDSYKILADLGCKASDLLQSNCVIWIEGPSDRHYLNKWISLKDDSLKEGLHYSIMFYGGRLLSHITADDSDEVPEELINLLKINKHCVVVMDSDLNEETGEINETKKRVKTECEKNDGFCWVTEGREIENYLHEESIRTVFNNKWGLNLNINLAQYTKIQESITYAARGKKVKLKDSQKYENHKVEFAREISKNIKKEHLDKLDLNNKLNAIIEKIKIWNGLSKTDITDENCNH